MIPKLHRKGSSFKGAAAYLLHDKDRAQTDERVGWTEVRNLATDNPHVAWRVMAATAMQQERLKEQAGVKKTGRKSLDAVLHFTLSWHPSEKKNLTRDEMARAANQALFALKASDRQALIVHHTDEEQPHIHILVNRVSSDDGRMLSSFKEKLALSTWAEAYEKDRGPILCEERAINNEARRRKEYTRGKKDKARNIFEAEANDNSSEAKKLREQERRKDAEIARKARELKEKQARNWDAFQEEQKQRVRDIRAQAARDMAAGKNAIRDEFRPRWTILFHERQAQMSAFLKNEKSLLGRVHNAMRQVDFKSIFSGATPTEEGRSRRSALSDAFKALSSAGARLEALKREQERERRALLSDQKRRELAAVAATKARREQQLQENRKRFETQRNDLILIQTMDGAKFRDEQNIRNHQRARAWKEHRDSQGRKTMPPPAPARDPAYVRSTPAPSPVETPQQKQQHKPEAAEQTQERPSHAPDVIAPEDLRQREIRELRERREQKERDRGRGRR
jgi:Relaxase/Mobilisation nuclease domain